MTVSQHKVVLYRLGSDLELRCSIIFEDLRFSTTIADPALSMNAVISMVMPEIFIYDAGDEPCIALLSEMQSDHLMPLCIGIATGDVVSGLENLTPLISSDALEMELCAVVKCALLYKAQNRNLLFEVKRRESLMAMVSHDLIGPFGVILGYIQMLSMGRIEGPELGPKQHEILGRMRDAAQRQLDFTEKMLDRSMLAFGSAPLKQDFKLTKELEYICNDYAEEVEAKRLTIQHKYCGSRAIRTDAFLFRKVLDNLISNAVRFTPAGGTVIISITGETGALCISVMNTGTRLSEEGQEKVFSVFERYYSHDTEGRRGTGMGLSLSASICTLLGFKMCVRSSGGETEFSILCPEEYLYHQT